MIIIEGNCWGNDYAGITPDWDDKLVFSFHKYWNRNDAQSIAAMLKLRETSARPIWLGESGENRNAWYRDAIALAERHDIGGRGGRSRRSASTTRSRSYRTPAGQSWCLADRQGAAALGRRSPERDDDDVREPRCRLR